MVVMQTSYIVNRGMYGVLDVLGPTVEFLTPPEDADAPYCAMIGTIPAGGSVPLHSHPDVESFFVVSGTVQVASQRESGFEWLTVSQGEFVQVPAGARHGFRNTSGEAVVQLVMTTPRLGRFFREIGRPVSSGVPPGPPTADELQRFIEVAAEYGHWLGSAEENAAIGISGF
jgi:quercetin dioxygenase-like cupin family protein